MKEFKISSITAEGVKTNRAPRTRYEVLMLRVALKHSAEMMKEKIVKDAIREWWDLRGRKEQDYPQGYRFNRAPWV